MCKYGDPDLTSPILSLTKDSWAVKHNLERYYSGKYDLVVFHGETDRYHLITTDYLRKGLEKFPDTRCYINGSCIGFDLDENNEPYLPDFSKVQFG